MRSVTARFMPLAAALTIVAACRISFSLELPPLSLNPLSPSHAETSNLKSEIPAAPTLTLSDDRFSPDDVRITLYWENDGDWAKPFDSHDRHYTAGVGASFAFRSLVLDHALANVPATGLGIAGNLDVAMGFTGNLTLYTPENFTSTALEPNDRPFAGYTFLGIFFQRAHRIPPPEFGLPAPATLLDPKQYSAFESLELDLGILGPSSLAQNAQELIHSTFNGSPPNGWVNQIHDEPQFSLKYNRRWRSQPIRPISGLPITVQLIPELDLTAGTLQDQLLAATTFRIGYNLQDDFGPGELGNPQDATATANCTCPGIFDNLLTNASIYVFARPYGRFVAHDALLQGDNFRHDDPVTQSPSPALFGIQTGIACRILKHIDLAYLTTYESPAFAGQQGWDSWSSVQVTFSMSW